MPIIKLTQDLIDRDQLTCPDDKRRIEYYDGHSKVAIPGLYLEVRQSGQTFYLRYKDTNGKTCHQKLGRATDIDLATAREKAKTLRAQIALGANPSAEAKAKKCILTFDEFWTHHCLPYLKTRKKTADKDDERYQHRLKAEFGHRKLNQISRHQLQSFHSSLKNEGLTGATCDHYIKVMRRAFNLAVEWGMLDKNPAERFPLYRDPNNVEHYLDNEELGRLLQVLRTHRNRGVCQIVLWLLSTGARLNEALQARWDHIDREHRIWRIPALNSKSKRVRAVPLNDTALDVLNELDTEGKYEHLFINTRRRKPYRNIAKTFGRIREESGLPHLRIHDLRHQFASHLVSAGKSLYQVQQILGHSNPIVTQRYAHLSTTALQDAAGAASEAINRAGKPDT